MFRSDGDGPGASGAILTLDTSAARCAAAVFLAEGVGAVPTALALRDEPMARGQAERLAPMIAEVLAEAGLSAPQLRGIVVCTGPGNFTGLRIAVAAARGLALGAGRPAVGVPRLEALAAARTGRGVASAAATRGRLYLQRFETREGISGPSSDLTAIDVAEAAETPLAEAEWVVGPLGRVLRRDADASDIAPLEALARLGAIALTRAEPARPAPIYLRPPDAAPPAEGPPPRLSA
ncbi:MAG: tRNA (adenosine(37)-N6)-threonylcarbamoyltransferase complex dimerization subunit type 1 TsaB [Pseudomonadota bacterium]